MLKNTGLRVQIDQTSRWNAQTMLRTELIGKFSQPDIYKGTVYFQFSMKQGSDNPLSVANEHQLVFFEAHFADIKYGGAGGTNIYFTLSDGTTKWSSDFSSGTWHNFALQVDYSGNQVALWHSTEASQLQQVVPLTATSVSFSDWHVGVLRLPLNSVQAANTEWLYYSGVYINSAIVPFTGSASINSDSDTGESGGMSQGGVAALVIFLLLFVIVFGVGFVRYQKNGHLFGYTIHGKKYDVDATNYVAFRDDDNYKL